MKKIPVSEVIKLNCLSNCTLLSGSRGLSNFVNWFIICFFNDIGNWVSGGEIIFLPGVGMDLSAKNIRSFMKQCHDKKVAAIFVILGYTFQQVPEIFIEEADKYGIPLFEMPNEYPLVQITKNLALMIHNQERHGYFVGDILKNAVFSDDIDASRFERDFIMQKVLLKEYRQLLVIKLKTHISEANLDLLDLYVESNTKKYFPESSFFFYDSNTFVVLISYDKLEPKQQKYRIQQMLANLEQSISPIALSIKTVGVSNSFYSLANCHRAYKEAITALEASPSPCADSLPAYPVYYSELSTLTKILNFVDGKVDSLECAAWNSLKKYDEKNGSALCETLRCYILSGNSVKEAAEKLFIHRNTLNYRKNQINTILDTNIDDPLVTVKLATQMSVFQHQMNKKNNIQ